MIKKLKVLLLISFILEILILTIGNFIVDTLPRSNELFIFLKDRAYYILIQLFGGKNDLMWLAITGIVAATAIGIPLLWESIQKDRNEDKSKSNLQKSFAEEVKRNIDTVLTNGVELVYEDDVYKTLIAKMSLVEDTQIFKIFAAIYKSNRYFNKIVESSPGRNSYYLLSNRKTYSLFDYIIFIEQLSGNKIFSKEDFSKIYNLKEEFEKLSKVLDFIQIKYIKYLDDNGISIDSFYVEIKEILINLLPKELSGLSELISAKVDEFVQLTAETSEYTQELEKISDNMAATGGHRSGRAIASFEISKRNLKIKHTKYEDFKLVVQNIQDHISTEIRAKVIKEIKSRIPHIETEIDKVSEKIFD